MKNSFWLNNFTWLLLFNSYQDYLVNISELWKVHTVDSNLSSFFLNAKLKSVECKIEITIVLALCHRKLFTAWMLDKLFLETFLDLVKVNSILKFYYWCKKIRKTNWLQVLIFLVLFFSVKQTSLEVTKCSSEFTYELKLLVDLFVSLVYPKVFDSIRRILIPILIPIMIWKVILLHSKIFCWILCRDLNCQHLFIKHQLWAVS